MFAGFTNRAESEYDPFGAGHSSTSISAALGMAVARDFKASIAAHIAAVIFRVQAELEEANVNIRTCLDVAPKLCAGSQESLRGSDWRRGHHRRHGLRGYEPCRFPGQEHDRRPERQPAGALPLALALLKRCETNSFLNAPECILISLGFSCDMIMTHASAAGVATNAVQWEEPGPGGRSVRRVGPSAGEPASARAA